MVQVKSVIPADDGFSIKRSFHRLFGFQGLGQTSSYASVEGKKICFAVVGTADRNTRHEAEASAPACIGLGIWVVSWQE
jgi:hypothetical protein